MLVLVAHVAAHIAMNTDTGDVLRLRCLREPCWCEYHVGACGPCSHWGPWVGQWSWCSQGSCWCLWPALPLNPWQRPVVGAAAWIHINIPGLRRDSPAPWWSTALQCRQLFRLLQGSHQLMDSAICAGGWPLGIWPCSSVYKDHTKWTSFLVGVIGEGGQTGKWAGSGCKVWNFQIINIK